MAPRYPKNNRVDVLLEFFQNNRFSAVIIIIGIIIISISNVAESGNNLLRTFGIIKKYEVGQESARGRFSYDLTENAWNRLFWMRNFVRKIELGAPRSEQAASWEKVTYATEKWSSNIMNYYIALDEYYPDGKKRHKLEYEIQPLFNSSTEMIVDLKYNLNLLDTVTTEKRILDIKKNIDLINIQLYKFVDQKPPKSLKN